MAQKGITKEIIVRGATALIEEMGYGNFTLHELATRLGIKPSSLYNHMKNMDDLKQAISVCAVEKLTASIQEATSKTEGKETLVATAVAIRSFAKNNSELYKAIFFTGGGQRALDLYSLVQKPLENFSLTKDESIHFCRAFSAAVFGFIMLDGKGYLSSNVDKDASFIAMVALLLSSLQVTKKVS
ncbi:MAG: TetR/AcrR family transcriptional regulator [Sphaerochaetaceae bacterium]